MKQRLLVMNGHRLIQEEMNGCWKVSKVAKAGSLQPGLYDLYFSQLASPYGIYEGTIVHIEKEYVFQKVDALFFKHEKKRFKRKPEIGATTTVKYFPTGSAALIAGKRHALPKDFSR